MSTGQFPQKRETEAQAEKRVKQIKERNKEKFYDDTEKYDNKVYVRKGEKKET